MGVRWIGLKLLLCRGDGGVGRRGAAVDAARRGAATVVVEAYAPNIVRVTMSLDKGSGAGSGGGVWDCGATAE